MCNCIYFYLVNRLLFSMLALFKKLFSVVEIVSAIIFFLIFVLEFIPLSILHLSEEQVIQIFNFFEEAPLVAAVILAVTLYRFFNPKLQNKYSLIIFHSIFVYFVMIGMFYFVGSSFGGVSAEYDTYSTNLDFKVAPRAFIVSMFCAFWIIPTLVEVFRLITKPKKYFFRFLLSLSLFLYVVGLFLQSAIAIKVLIRTSLTQPYTKPLNPTHLLTNPEKIYISENYSEVLSCLYSDTKNPYFIMLKFMLGKTVLFSNDSFLMYSDDKCVVFLMPNSESAAINDIDKLSEISEAYIRGKLGRHIILQTNVSPSSFVRYQEKNDRFISQSIGVAGYYNPYSEQIVLSENVATKLEVIVHEQLHAFTSPLHQQYSSYPVNGLNEGITQYLTRKILNESGLRPIPLVRYINEVKATEALLTIIDENRLIDTYFNGNYKNLENEVDSELQPGAFCTFNEFLDTATTTSFTGIKNDQERQQYFDAAINSISNPGSVQVTDACSPK